MAGDFHKRLKRLREEKKLSMRDAAKSIGVPESTYKEWEYGRKIRGEPYLQIAQAFGVSLDELFGASDDTGSSTVDLVDRMMADMKKLRKIVSAPSK